MEVKNYQKIELAALAVMKKLGPEVGHLRDLPNETVEKVFYYNNIIVDMQIAIEVKYSLSFSSSECSLRIRAVITSCEQARFRCLLLFSNQRRSSYRQQKSSTLRGL